MEFQSGSAGIQIQKIVDILETEGESGWATKIDEAYYSHFGIDAVRAALGQLRLLQKEEEILDRLEIRDTVSSVVKVLSLAAGEEDAPAQPLTNAAGARQLLDSLHDEEQVHSLGSATDGARRLLDTLRDEKP